MCVSVYVGGLSTWQMDCLRGREPTVTGTAHTVFLCVSRAFPVRLAQCDDMREGMYFWSRRGRRFSSFPEIFSPDSRYKEVYREYKNGIELYIFLEFPDSFLNFLIPF